MNLLAIMNRVCAQASLPQYSAFYSTLSLNTTDGATAKELLVHAYEAGEEITRRAEWSKLYSSDVIPINASSWTIPDSCHRLIQGNAISLTGTLAPILPVRSFDVWSVFSALPSSQIYYFVNQGIIEFSSQLPSSAKVYFIDRNWIRRGATETEEFATDTDTVVFSDSLFVLGILWRYKRAKGLDYADLQSEFEAELAREIAADRGIN